MILKKIENKKEKFNEKKLIYLKELKPEMTQCRVVQVEQKIKDKENDKL